MSAYSFEVHASTAADLKQVSRMFRDIIHRRSPLNPSFQFLVLFLTCLVNADNEDDIIQRLRRAGGANYDRSKFD
jgi:hypothetical protein